MLTHSEWPPYSVLSFYDMPEGCGVWLCGIVVTMALI